MSGHLVIAVETVAPSWRVHAGTVVNYMFSTGYMLIALLAYFIRDWFTLQMVLGAPTVILLTYLWYVCIQSPPLNEAKLDWWQ